MVMACLAMTGFGQTWQIGSPNVDNVTATLSNGTLTISGTGNMTDFASSSSAPWYSVISQITQVAIGAGVTRIGNYAFAGCTGLASVTIPGSVITLGNSIFQDCSGLTELTLPYVGASTTAQLTPLGYLFGTASNSDMQAITQRYSLSSSLTCYLPKNLKKITLTSPCSTLYFGAFSNCTMLEEIVLPSSLTTIATWAFLSCSSLTSITIPANVTSIDPTAFLSCNNLTSIDVESDNANFSSSEGILMNKEQTMLLNCPNGKTGNIVIPDGVNTIGESAFNSCSALTSVVISNSVTSIGYGAFIGCNSLTSVVIPNSVTSIDQYVFENCTGLISVTIGSGITSIGNDAFYNCSGLRSMFCLNPNPSSITLSSGSLYNIDTNQCALIVPVGSVTLYQNAPQWKDFQIITDGTTILTNLTVSAGTLSPIFNSYISNYQVTVPQNVGSITLTATPVAGATVSGDGQKTLNLGDNTFEITVATAQETLVYTVVVTRTLDTYLLTNLDVSSGILSPAFSPDVFTYQVTVPQSIDNIVLTATPLNSDVTVTGDGKMALNTGDNTFEITAVSPTLGSFVYTVTVTRAESDILLRFISADEITSGSTRVTHSGTTFNLIDQYKFNYELILGNVSGDFPLHFDIDNGRSTLDTIINVKAYSIYDFTLYMWKPNTDYYNPFFTTATIIGGMVINNMTLIRHAGDVVVSEGSDVLSTTSYDFAASGFSNVSLSEVTLISSPTPVPKVILPVSINIFPNPATDFITIYGLQSNEMFYIYNINGQQLLSRKASGETEQVTVSYLPAGIYLLKTNDGQTVKWVKK